MLSVIQLISLQESVLNRIQPVKFVDLFIDLAMRLINTLSDFCVYRFKMNNTLESNGNDIFTLWERR